MQHVDRRELVIEAVAKGSEDDDRPAATRPRGHAPRRGLCLLDELERRDLKTAMLTLCVGGGMGIATIIERV